MRVGSDRRGVALMLVLWLIVVLGALAAGVGASMRSEARVVANVRARSVARYAAESGVVAATARLTALLRAAETPRDQALVFRRLDDLLAELRDETLGPVRFQVAVADLNARIDLNAADETTLLGLVQPFVGEVAGRALVDALQDWKDEDDEPRSFGAEAAAYAAAGAPFRPSNRPLLRLDELTRIAGFTDSIASLLAPYITVRSDGRINLNTAPEPVLAAIGWLGPAGAAVVVAERERGIVYETPAGTVRQLTRDISVQGQVDVMGVTTMPRRILIVSRGWQLDHALTHEIQAVYELDAVRLGTPRLTVRFWTERDL